MKRGLAFFLLLTLVPLPAAAGSFEKTIPVPRNRDADLEWREGECTVYSLTLRNYPDDDDIEQARREDPDDKTWLWWEFNVGNRGNRKCKIKLWVEVLDKGGKVIKASDRSDTVSPGETDDEIRVSTLMKTLDIVNSPKVRLRAEIRPE